MVSAFVAIVEHKPSNKMNKYKVILEYCLQNGTVKSAETMFQSHSVSIQV